MNKWLIAGALAAYYVYSTRRPKWLDDVLMRCYAKDYLANGQVEVDAANAAAEYGMPTKWLVWLHEKGIPKELLSLASKAVGNELLRKGPPKNATPEELERYKMEILNSVLARGGK